MRFLDIFVICILCDDDYKDIVERVGVLYKVYWCVYVYYMEMNIIIMLIVDSMIDSWWWCICDRKICDSYICNNSCVCW